MLNSRRMISEKEWRGQNKVIIITNKIRVLQIVIKESSIIPIRRKLELHNIHVECTHSRLEQKLLGSNSFFSCTMVRYMHIFEQNNLLLVDEQKIFYAFDEHFPHPKKIVKWVSWLKLMFGLIYGSKRVFWFLLFHFI